MAIKLIINRERGLPRNENINQGAFIIDEPTGLVGEAVLKEFEAISERGGALGAMETGYLTMPMREKSSFACSRRGGGRSYSLAKKSGFSAQVRSRQIEISCGAKPIKCFASSPAATPITRAMPASAATERSARRRVSRTDAIVVQGL
jgi:hypothetical protein